jgi:hypothetical protein
MMKLNIFFNIMHNDGENNDNYVIWIFRNVRCIFDTKNNGVYGEC